MMSSSNFNSPDIDPSNDGTLAGCLNFVFKKLSQNQNGMLPAKVITYNRETNRATVQLLITQVTTNGDFVSRPQLATIPVLLLGGGNYFLSFPLQPGNLGWVCANDRDISLFLQSYEEKPPNTARMFSFSDGLFIPDVMTEYTIAEEDADNAVLQSLDGTVRISLASGYIKLTAPLVTVNGALEATDGLTITGGGATPFTVTGNMRLNGNMTVVGDIGATGDITPHIPPP